VTVAKSPCGNNSPQVKFYEQTSRATIFVLSDLRATDLQNANLSRADFSLDNINHAADLCGANLAKAGAVPFKDAWLVDEKVTAA
jgi:uncharacterized protein YjbI with pentapeptide repeats